MIPNALIYDAQFVNARSRDAARNTVNLGSVQEPTNVVADCAGVRTPCLYRAEAAP
ncbi:MAG: hypothetical protein LUO79_07865 [Methanomassiliicoccales archaeon]|nr:hypothetical protein [Methanomassiliicoccales archaeon]